MLTPSAGTPPPPPFSLSSPVPTPTSSFLPTLLSPPRHRRRRRCLPVPKAAAFPPRRAAPLSANNLPAPEQTPPPSTSTSASPARPSPAFAAGGYRAGGEDPLVSKLRTQLGVIHPLPAPPPLPALPRSVLGLFALFFFVGAAFDKLLTLRRRRRAEREVRVNGSWPQVPTSGFSLFLEEKDLQRKESVEWVNMVLIEGWIVGLLQPVIDNLQKPDYVNRVEIRQFHLGEEPLSVRNVERGEPMTCSESLLVGVGEFLSII